MGTPSSASSAPGVLLAAHAGTTPGRRPRRPGRRRSSATTSPAWSVGERLGQLDDRPGAGQPAAVEARPRLTAAPPTRGAAAPRAPGSAASRRSTSAGSVSRPRETRTLPWVSAPIAASTWLGSSVLAVHADPLATAKPQPVELGDQRLAVDVEEGERDQVGEPRLGVADHLGVGDRRRRAARTRSTRPCSRRLTLVALGDDGPQRRGRGQGAGDVLEPGGALVDAVVAREGWRQRAPLRTSSTPTPAGPPHLCAEPAAADQPAGERERAHRGAGVGEQRRVAERGGGLLDRLEGADLVVGRLEGDHGQSAPRGGATATLRPGRAGRSRSTGQSRTHRVAACQGRRAARRSARRRSAADRAALARGGGVQAEQAEVDGVGAAGREGDLVGAHVEALRDHGPGVVEQQPGLARLAVQAPRIGVPPVERLLEHLPRRRVQRRARGVVEIAARGDARFVAGPPDGTSLTGRNLPATCPHHGVRE